MGLFITGRNEERSELQSKIIADLREKARQSSLDEGDKTYDDARLLENQHETRTAGVVIGLLLVVLVVVIVFVVIQSR